MHRCSNAQVQQCTGAAVHRCSNAQVQQCTGAAMHRCSNAMHRCSNAQAQQCTGTATHRRSSAQVQHCTGTAMFLHLKAHPSSIIEESGLVSAISSIGKRDMFSYVVRWATFLHVSTRPCKRFEVTCSKAQDSPKCRRWWVTLLHVTTRSCKRFEIKK